MSKNKRPTARQLMDSLPSLPKIPFRGLNVDSAEAEPADAAPADPNAKKKISSGSTTFFRRKLEDPNRPRSKWNKPKSEYRIEPLLGEAVVKRMIDEDTQKTEETVACPVCDGSKVSRVTGQPCTRCDSTGKITAKTAKALKGTNADITKRLLGLGEDYASPEEFGRRPGGPDDPLRQSTIHVPHGEFDYSGPKRSGMDDAADDPSMREALKIIGTLNLTPEDVDHLMTQSASLTSEYFLEMVQGIRDSQKMEQPPVSNEMSPEEREKLMQAIQAHKGKPPSRFDLSFFDESAKAVVTRMLQ